MPTPVNVFQALNNTVWAITPEKFEEISGLVQSFATRGTPEMTAPAQPKAAVDMIRAAEGDRTQIAALYDRMGVTIDGGVAVVPVRGTVMKRMNMFSEFSGGVSTEMLAGTLNVLAVDPAVKGVVLDVDSPGGSVEGLTEAASAIRGLLAAKGDNMVKAVANDMMASAAYWMGSAVGPGNLYATNDAVVGSIGVITSRWDYSEAYAKAGVKQEVWRSADYKALGQAGEPVTAKEREDRGRLVDEYYENFVNAVASNRFQGDTKKARSLADGRVFVGANALQHNLIDDMKTVAEAVADLKVDATHQDRAAALEAALTENNTEFAALQAKFDALKAENVTLKTEKQTAENEAKAAKATEFISSLVASGKAVAALSDTSTDSYKKLHAALVSDFDAASLPFEFVAAGSAAPGSMPAPAADADAEGAVAKLVAQAEAKGIYVSLDAEETEVLTAMEWQEVSGDLSVLSADETSKKFVKGYAE